MADLTFQAFLSHTDSQQTVKSYADKNGWSASQVHGGDITAAIAYLKDHPSPDILLVELPSAAEAPALLDKLADVCAPTTKVVATGQINEFSFYRWLTELGIVNYLLQPVKAEELDKTVQQIKQPVAVTEKKPQLGMLVAVIGTRGGVGATTAAVNLGYILSHEHKKKTAVVDLDPHFGTVAMAFDLEPGRGLKDAFEKPDRVDALFIDRVMIKQSEHLWILSSEEAASDEIKIAPRAAEHLLGFLRNRFSVVVVDIPRHLDDAGRQTLKQADHIIIVSEANLASLRDAMRLSDYCREKLRTKKPLHLLNRIGLAKKYELAKPNFEKSLNDKVSYEIPFIHEAFANSNVGEPMVKTATGGPAATVYRTMASDLLGGGPPEEEAKGIGKLKQMLLGKK